MNWGFAGTRKGFSAAVLGLCVVAATMASSPANAIIDPAHQFVVNGDFEQTTNGLGQLRQSTDVVGWTSKLASNGDYGFTFVMNPSTASSTGSPGQYGQEALWGPGNGANNGLSSSPTGGNFVGADGAYNVSKLTQAITGLIVGQTYTLSFNFAGAQEYGTDGASMDSWKFGFQNQGISQQTSYLNNVSHGFTGWQTQTYNFVASQTSDTLYFLAAGTPAGQPPFSLLDSVSLTGAYVSAAPDSATWLLMIIGFGSIGFTLRRRAPRLERALAA